MQVRSYFCAIVDACSTARLLAPAFAALGYSSVHIQTPRRLGPAQLSGPRVDDFVENIVFDGDLEQLVSHLQSRYPGLACVVPGLESGVVLADRLSERLGLPTNGSALSLARRDKFVMADAVARCGLSVIPVIKSREIDHACAWVRDCCLDEVVLKPKSSSGTFGFNICSGERELRETFARLLGSNDIFGDTVDEVLVQPLVAGQEYAVNCVSRDGRHLVTDIWRTDKSRRGQSKVYEKEILIHAEASEYAQITRYVKGVLDALGIRHGPSHTEVMMTPSGEVLLIESAARLMGSLDVSLVTSTLGHNAVQLTAEAYLVPDRFKARLDAPAQAMQGRSCMAQMLATQRGRLAGFDVDRMRALASFHGADFYQKPGDKLVPTIDSYSSPGLVFLSHADPDVVESDYRTLRDWERQGLVYLVG